MKLSLVFAAGLLIGAIGAGGFCIWRTPMLVQELQLVQLYCEQTINAPWD